MPDVSVTGTARLKCRNEKGQFYWEPLTVTAITQKSDNVSDYEMALYLVAADQVPSNCEGIDWHIDGVEDIPGGGGDEPIQLVTIYMHVWCEYEDGSLQGPFTQTFDVPTDSDLSYLIGLAQEIADQLCLGGTISYISKGAVRSKWEIYAPLYYQYFRD